MLFRSRLKNNDALTAYEHNVSVETLHAFIREYDGTISHYISLKWPLSKDEDFLYKRVSRYKKASQAFTIFTFSTGNGTYHGIRGYGHEIFPFVQTSNRRFRDDEFLLPRVLTEGREKIRVRVKFTPVERPLFPGHPIPELAWSEIKYFAYSYVMPK